MREDGTNESEHLTLAARDAPLKMIDSLGTRGFDRQQPYALCSVPVDLRVSQVVDVPNFTVSALLPLDIFVWCPGLGIRWQGVATVVKIWSAIFVPTKGLGCAWG